MVLVLLAVRRQALPTPRRVLPHYEMSQSGWLIRSGGVRMCDDNRRIQSTLMLFAAGNGDRNG
jgi:hypothetical protein